MNFRVSVIVTLLLALLVVPVSAQDDDGEATLGEVVTIEGEVQEILSPYSFVLRQTEPFDFAPSEIVVVNDDTQPFAVDVNVGRHLRVTGSIYAFDSMTVEADIDYDLEDEVFVNYDADDYSMIGETVELVAARTPDTVYNTAQLNTDVTMDMLEDNPFDYIGQIVTLQGEVEERYTDTSFLMEEDEFFDLDPMQIPVFAAEDITYPEEGMNLMNVIDDELYSVTGEVVAFNLLEIENRLGIGYDPALYVDFDEDNVAIIATDVTRTDG